MFNTLRYPTKQQGIIWLRRRQKDRPTDIARDLKVSRPFVTMEQKRAEGYCHANDSQTYITYSPKIGVLSWYEHIGDCGTCDIEDQCKEALHTLADEWEIPAPPDMPPTELSEYLFNIIRRRLKWDTM
jgi:hypothetical protein